MNDFKNKVMNELRRTASSETDGTLTFYEDVNGKIHKVVWSKLIFPIRVGVYDAPGSVEDARLILADRGRSLSAQESKDAEDYYIMENDCQSAAAGKVIAYESGAQMCFNDVQSQAASFLIKAIREKR